MPATAPLLSLVAGDAVAGGLDTAVDSTDAVDAVDEVDSADVVLVVARSVARIISWNRGASSVTAATVVVVADPLLLRVAVIGTVA